jgi:DNA-binding SARP family transcriptional activator/streptogramin lyase
MQFRILGPLEVVSAGNAVPLGGTKQRALLALLLVHRNEPVSVDRIVDELWGEQPPPTAVKNVQVYVSHLRKALGAEALQTTPPGYTLRVSGDALDAERVERSLADALDRAPAARVELLREASALWRGPPLAEFADLRFAQAEIARLDELRLHVLKRRLAAELELGRHDDVLVELERLVAAHPLDEYLRGQLMLALYRSGRQADALAQFREARRVLRDELGLEPDEELRDLERRILEHDPGLRPPLPFAVSQAEAPARRRHRVPLVAYAGVGLLAAVLLVLGFLALPGEEPAAEVVVSANTVAVVDADRGEVIAAIPVGRGPEMIVSGTETVWVANVGERTLSRLDPETLEVTKTIGLGFEPTDLAADGNQVWVAGGYDHVLWRVDRDGLPRLKLGFVERVGSLPPGFERGPAGVAVGAGSVWLSHGDEVTELDPASGEIRGTTEAGGRWHPEIAVGGGWVWVGRNTSLQPASDVGLERFRVDGGGKVELVKLVSDPSEALYEAQRLWAAVRIADTVWELDSASGQLQRTIAAGQLPLGMALDEGALWITSDADEDVRRVDARSGETEVVVPIGHTVREVAVANGRVFVTVRGP